MGPMGPIITLWDPLLPIIDLKICSNFNVFVGCLLNYHKGVRMLATVWIPLTINWHRIMQFLSSCHVVPSAH